MARSWVLLLRGINVGGKNILPMADFRSILGDLGCTDVKTYIQSGNAVFNADIRDRGHFETDLSTAINTTFGFAPHTLLMPAHALATALEANPFPAAIDDPKTLHLSFLSKSVKELDTDGIDSLRADTEQYALRGDVFYMYAPDGIGRSKLAAKVEKILGVPITARNLRSVMKIAEMAEN